MKEIIIEVAKVAGTAALVKIANMIVEAAQKETAQS